MAIQRLQVPLGGGVNVFDDPVAIPDGQWQRLRNLATRQTGVLGQRQSMSFVREVIPTWAPWDGRLHLSGDATKQCTGYWEWAAKLRPLRFIFDPNHGEITMVAITTDSKLVRTSPGDVLVTVAAHTYLLITLPGVILSSAGIDANAPRVAILGTPTGAPSLFTFLGITYAFAGGNSGVRVEPIPDGSVGFSYLANDFGTGNEDFKPDGACVVRNRVAYYIGPNVYFSGKNDPLEVGDSVTATRGLFLGGEQLENISAISEISTSADGSPVQSVVAVWTPTSCTLLLGEFGEPTETDVYGSIQINRLNIEAGCVSQATVVRTPYGVVWAGIDDVWFMPFGALPIRVGTSIRPYLKDQPQGLLWKLHAEYHDGFYRLSMFKSGQGPDILSPCGMQMWLDLRKGAPASAEQAQWFGPQIFTQVDAPTSTGATGGAAGVWCMARDTRGTGDGKLYALQSYVMLGLSPGSYIKGMSLCGFDTVAGRDTCAPQAEVSHGLWQASTAYYEGDIMVPTPSGTSLLSPIFVCTTSGTSDSDPETPPSWYSSADADGAIVDNSVVWHPIYWDPPSDSPPGVGLMSAYMPKQAQLGNEIEWSMLSKELMLGDPMVEKLLDGAEIGYATTAATRLTYNSHPKQDSQSRVLGLTTDVTEANENLMGSWTGARVWQRKLLTPSPTARFHGLTATWECQQDAGIVLRSALTLSGSMDGVSFTAEVAAGYYADLEALATATAAAMNASATGIAKASAIVSTIQEDGEYIRALVGFRDTSPGQLDLTILTTSALARLFGYHATQGTGGGPTSTGVNGAFAYGAESPHITYAPDMQLSGITFRVRPFGRRPT